MSQESDSPARILLCSLGRSWAVVPEAFHRLSQGNIRRTGFVAVHVLTTEDSEIMSKGIPAVRSYFETRYPEVALTFTMVSGFPDLKSEQDHFRFEEVLYRWILDVAPRSELRWFCLAGGFKTMSAAMQKAAALLGAAELFHVLVNGKIETAEQVDQAAQGGDVRL